MRLHLLGLLLLTGSFACTGCKGSYVEPLPRQAIKHRARTSDGWELALVQYKPTAPARGRPVLLCHGVSANDRNMDLDADHSLARWLASQGRETWTMALRGTGESDKVDDGKGRKAGYSFDTYWRADFPAAIQYVRSQTGAQDIDFVGHSMGGMIAYAYLSQGGTGIAALTVMGSPTRLDWGGSFDPLLDRMGNAILGKEWVLPMAVTSGLFAGLQGEWDGDPVQTLIVNPKNTTPKTLKKLVAMGTADVSGALALWFLRMVKSGRFESEDGTIDFRRDMGRISTPVLVVAGKMDRVAIAPAVKDGYRALGGPKEWRLIGEENGAQADYGHLDLLVGDRAATEVWPHLLDFFERHPGAPPETEPRARGEVR